MKIVSSRTAGRMLVGFAAAVGLACATLAIAQAPTIAINVKNNTGQDYVVHVYELFAGENREVRGSPITLASKETSKSLIVRTGPTGTATISYECETGPSKANIDVSTGQVISIDD
ncbi:MAG TPA: hypothetical protein VKR38_04240 [Usitatibacter sp.]|nr:hypothetical protein [Usitatibacter sp.]